MSSKHKHQQESQSFGEFPLSFFACPNPDCAGFTYTKPVTPKPLLGLHRGRFSTMAKHSRRSFRRRPRPRR